MGLCLALHLLLGLNDLLDLLDVQDVAPEDPHARPQAVLAERALLVPAALEDLDAEALVVGVVAREVAVRLQPRHRVAADEEEFFVVAHFDKLGTV
ncbi:hypothetical protein F5Y01DRAFT_317239 [Xylaria sp. FL0043]|nr:hypothetical protein F5Y01DRAFT_317239 [Xylaria sp. FL0043]